MKIKRAVLVLLFILLILVSICALVIYQPFSPPPEPYMPNQTLWIDAWLENPVCQPPCLDNIIPGVTPADEVAEKLSVHPGVLRVEREKKNYYTEAIRWYTPENEMGQLGEVTVNTDTQIVSGIEIYSNSNVAKILLGDFIDVFGEPDYVYPYTDAEFISSTCVAHLYYVDKGMSVRFLLTESTKERVNITPDTLISGIGLLPPQPDIEQTLKQFSYAPQLSDINKIVPWEGYGKYRCEP